MSSVMKRRRLVKRHEKYVDTNKVISDYRKVDDGEAILPVQVSALKLERCLSP